MNHSFLACIDNDMIWCTVANQIARPSYWTTKDIIMSHCIHCLSLPLPKYICIPVELCKYSHNFSLTTHFFLNFVRTGLHRSHHVLCSFPFNALVHRILLASESVWEIMWLFAKLKIPFSFIYFSQNIFFITHLPRTFLDTFKLSSSKVYS